MLASRFPSVRIHRLSREGKRDRNRKRGAIRGLVEDRCGYAKALAMVRDEMKFLNDEDKSWMLSKTIERVWPFA